MCLSECVCFTYGADVPHLVLPESGINRVRAGEVVFCVEAAGKFRPSLSKSRY